MNRLLTRLPILDVIFPALSMAKILANANASDFTKQEVMSSVAYYELPIFDNLSAYWLEEDTIPVKELAIEREVVEMEKFACHDSVRKNLVWYVRIGFAPKSKKVLYSDAGHFVIDEREFL